MDITESLNLSTLKPLGSDGLTNPSDLAKSQKEKFAKDFESVFIEKLFDEMKNTIGNWGFEQDGASKQIQGLFWMNLARDISKNGGLGMWKDIYQSLEDMENKTDTSELIDRKL